MKIKVLELDWTMKEEFAFEDMLPYLVKIEPIVNRHGHYYDRLKKKVWWETPFGAFEPIEKEMAQHIDYFNYEIEQLSHKPLHPKAAEAIVTLQNFNVCPENLRRLQHIDACWHSTRSVGRNSRKWMLRSGILKKNKE